MEDYGQRSLKMHEKYGGKISIASKIEVNTSDDLSIVYSPGVAQPCIEIKNNPEDVWKYTIKKNTVAVITDGSAVLGLGNIGALASIPVMEGKAMLFKKFANIDAFPICIATQDPIEIIQTIRNIAPVFGGMNLEDIAAPKSFLIEDSLQDLGIPVFHDDQHGTAIVTLAALINAAKVVGKHLSELKVVINGAGAAGIAIARMLKCVDQYGQVVCTPVHDVILCDTRGAISRDRLDLNDAKKNICNFTNKYNKKGTLQEVIKGADVFIGVSIGKQLWGGDVRNMAKNPIIFAMSNPIPEIEPQEALDAGAAIVGTGRSDLPNQVNNVLGFPGIFRGALDARAKVISPGMKLAAAYAIADCIQSPAHDCIIPPALDMQVAQVVAEAVRKVALRER